MIIVLASSKVTEKTQSLSLTFKREGVVNLKKGFKFRKLVVCLLVLLLLTNTGVSALAAPYGGVGGSQQTTANEELMQFLADEYGAENADSMLQTITDLGLVGSDGQISNHPIYVDGKKYTLEKIKKIIADEKTDLTQMAEIDGEKISLDTLRKIIDIETQLEALKKVSEADDVTITPEHLDKLDSLITQANDKGLEFYDEEGNSLTGNEEDENDVSTRSLAAAGDSGDYDDATFVTVTNFEALAPGLKRVWFRLSKPQTEIVSFSYELINGTFGSVNSKNPSSGTVTFEPGEVKGKLEFKVDSSKVLNNTIDNSESFINSKFFKEIDSLPVEERLDMYVERAWIGDARADYIHFSEFKNIDYIDFSLDKGHYTFTHSYNDGAYLAYGSGGPRDVLYGKGVDFFSKAMSYGYNRQAPEEIRKVIIKDGDYITGQMLPIAVTFNRPVVHKTYKYNPDNNPVLELANGEIATPEIMAPFGGNDNMIKDQAGIWRQRSPGGISFIQGYQTIIKKDTTLDGLKVLRNSGEASTMHYPYHYIPDDDRGGDTLNKSTEWGKDFSNTPNITISHAMSDAFQSLELDKSSYLVGETAKVTVKLDSNKDRLGWILDGATTPEEISKKLKVSLGNKEQGLVDLDWKKGEDDLPVDPYVLEGTYEITKDIEELMSTTNKKDKKLRAKIYYKRDTTSSGEDIKDFRLLLDTFAYLEVKEPIYITSIDVNVPSPIEYTENNAIQLKMTDPIPRKLGYSFYPDNATYVTPDQFEWKSSDETIATIKEDGTIVPIKAGFVKFSVIAKNNGEVTPPVEGLMSNQFEIDDTGVNGIYVPEFTNTVYTKIGQEAKVIWMTDVMTKYKELAKQNNTPVTDANFEIELYEGFWKDTNGKNPIKKWQAPETSELVNATSFTIPGEYIKTISSNDNPSYTVQISTKDPETQKKTLSALSYIVVNAENAEITLNKSMEQFITDETKSLELKWDLKNFDINSHGDFEFKVTKNGVVIPESLITFDKDKKTFSKPSATAEGGSYMLPIDPVTKSDSIKDVYAITLAAKNSTDSTWSYDSFYLQVYKRDALDIQIDGQSKQTHTMSNLEEIEKMSNDDRVALKRDISLKNDMSINHKDYKGLGELTDQIKWKSSNPDTGIINFKGYGEIANIEKYNLASYQPKHNFILSGLENGETTITATHAKTGIEAELDVTIETLRDKLYLFQFYPKTETTIRYTNGDGEEKKFTSNKDGELALYDESGVASDVYVTSEFNNTTYTGVLDQETLLSKEKDPASLELYPLNILQLRQLSKVELYFKTPDGKPYTGKVTYRGGVYKNDNYAELTEIGGKGKIKTLGADGKLEVIFDTTDFYSKEAGESNASTLSAKDKIDIVFEATFENDAYLPQILYLDGNTNPVDMITFGEKIASLIENPTSKKTPSIVNQFTSNAKNKDKTSIITHTGKFGPNNYYNNVKMTTEFMWWGEKVDEEAYVELQNEVGFNPQGQSYQTIKYPFTDTYITRHEQVLNKDTMWLNIGESGSVHFKLYKKPNEFRKSFTSAATLINMIGVQDISKKDLSNELNKLKEDMEKASGRIIEFTNNDKIAQDSLKMMANLKMNVGPLSMKVIPTDDPLAFITIMSTSIGGIPTTEGGNTIGGSSNVELYQNKDITLAPGLGDVKKVAENTYLAEQKKEYTKSQKTNKDGGVLFSVGGYYIGEIKYNVKTGEWETTVHGGGFNAGGGFEFSQNLNVKAGPVPVTFSLTVGGGLEVDFKASVLFDEVSKGDWKNPDSLSVNDYLTSLRVIAYIEAFGGVGFDYSVIAAKIGVFGRVTVENTSTWLNRDYLAKTNNQVLYGNKLTLESIVGVRVVLKFLFISIKHDFASFRYSHTWVYNNWKNIQDYWEKHGVVPLTEENLDMAIAAYMESIGEDPMQVIESNTIEDRDYLGEHDRSWQKPDGLLRGFFSLDKDNGAPKELQTNAYPYADPKVAQDGSLFVYLSDSNSPKIEDTVASWAVKKGSGYEDKGPIAPDAKGNGDTGLQIAGEDDKMAAVWVTQKEKIEKEAGEEVTNEDILLMNNSAEIMASIYNGDEWVTQQLTKNTSPDLAPVVSVGKDKVFVAYRSVYSSNTENPLDFSKSDSIVYMVYDMKTKKWSDVETLYNGTQGTVMGLSTETLSDGTTAVVYNVNKGNVNNTPAEEYVGGTDNEIIYAVIDTDADASAKATTWKPKGVVKNLQVTNDDNVNENPQLTSAKFADGVERFIVGWHTTSEETGNVDQDIKLFVINKDGEVYTEFVDSLNALSTHNNVKIHPNFSFAKMENAHKKVENLSILWKEAETDISPTEIITRDAVKAVKFGIDKDEVYLSGVIDVATMPDFTEVDTVDAYVNNKDGTEIKALILGTTYTTDTKKVGDIKSTTGDGDEIPVNVSKTVSGMYTATETYNNKFNADEIILTPTDIVSGYDMPIQFNIVNQGLSKIDKVTIDVGGDKTVYKDVSLLPNNSKVLTAPYNVPAAIEDIDYTVDVTFSDKEKLSTKGKLKLDIPDVGISKVKIVEEEGGKRTLSVPIYNKNGTTLENKNRVVKFGLYKEPVYTDENLIGKAIEISSNADLNMIDNGGYTKNVEFSIKDYLTALDLKEIPDKGITIYLHSWVEDQDKKVITEFDESNNDAKVVFENLSVKHNNDNILLTLEQTNSASDSSVNLSMQNMNMAPVSDGNVLLNLLNEKGDIIESKYVATTSAQLLAFTEEEKKTANVQFSKKGDDVQAIFFKENADQMDSTLSSVALSGIQVDFDKAELAYKLVAKDLKHTEILATAANSQSTVSLIDAAGKVISSNKGFVSVKQDLLISPDGALNNFMIRVEPESQSGKATDYTFAITNTKSAMPNLELLVHGQKNQDGTYSGDVNVSISPYDVTGFAIEKVSYKVNNGAWKEEKYDGKIEQILTTLTKEEDYTVEAKVVLTSGLEYVLDTETFKISKKTNSGGSGGSGGTPPDSGNPENKPEEKPEETEPETGKAYKVITKKGTYQEAKVWTVKMSKGVDVSTVKDALYLTDAKGNRVPAIFKSDGNNIFIQPPAGNYVDGTYTLYITSKLKDKSKKVIEEPIKMIFTIKAGKKPENDDVYQVIVKEGTFPTNKDWPIDLAMEIDESTIEGALFLYDEKGKSVPARFTSKGKTVVVHSPIDGYAKGTYTLYITDKLKDKKGKKLKKPIKMIFTIK